MGSCEECVNAENSNNKKVGTVVAKKELNWNGHATEAILQDLQEDSSTENQSLQQISLISCSAGFFPSM